MASISRQSCLGYTVICLLLINVVLFFVGDAPAPYRIVGDALGRFGFSGADSDTVKGDDVSDSVAEPETAHEVELESLKDLCADTTWHKGLWVHCHSACGPNKKSFCMGLNNARNRVQTCVRLAIDAGAGVILPSIATRDPNHLVNTGTDRSYCPDTWWDIASLKDTMQTACPQLKVEFCPPEDKPEIDRVITVPFRRYLEASHHTGSFHTLVDAALADANLSVNDVSATDPLVIDFGDTYIGWNYRESGELGTIRKALFRALPFNRTLLDLSMRIFERPQLRGGDFIGVHLRGESDWPAGFGTVQTQMAQYVEAIEHIAAHPGGSGTRTVFVSCGDRGSIQTFREMLQPLGYEVYDKWGLLEDRPDDLQIVESQRFDQKAIIEYQVLVGAKYFIGVIMSSMSSMIAFARTVDDEHDFFETYIYPNSSKHGLTRSYHDNMAVKGNMLTNLMVINGHDIMDSFP
ncbi:Alternative oxidase [Pleurostoma richardsiae]|uniref:Alternative oxidase n=1 Tax=Pleurostoma richardsiae TaxID=41990 RepID=A0AA38VVH3_9PEZI|nr:Alternative oxidase [Pleurostoma richardsiae]